MQHTRNTTAGEPRTRSISLRVDRVTCALLAVALHVGLAFGIGHATVRPSITATEHSALDRRAMLVTAFISEEEARRAPRFVMLSAADLAQSSSSIVIPLPQLPNIRPVAIDSFERAREIATSEDVEKAQRLQGVYVGQIKARLLRLLEDARHSRAVSDGNCVVHVVQDDFGRVLDVMSDECTANAKWREVVESAIRHASPLPLPPEGLAMGSYLTLDLSTLQ
jgi:hypothetical protein